MNTKNKDFSFIAAQFFALAVFVGIKYAAGLYRGQFGFREFFPAPGYALALAGVGLALAACIQLFRAGSFTALPTPRQGSELITGGVYAYVRHPIYTGILLLCAGLSLVDCPEIGLAWTLVIGWVLLLKSRYEEKKLALKFPEYTTYMKQTRPFFPFPHPRQN